MLGANYHYHSRHSYLCLVVLVIATFHINFKSNVKQVKTIVQKQQQENQIHSYANAAITKGTFGKEESITLLNEDEGPVWKNTTFWGDEKSFVSTSTNMKSFKLVFVHLGKTAGSSITCMLHSSIHSSGYGNSQCDEPSRSVLLSNEGGQTSELSKYVVERVHLVPAPVDTF